MTEDGTGAAHPVIPFPEHRRTGGDPPAHPASAALRACRTAGSGHGASVLVELVRCAPEALEASDGVERFRADTIGLSTARVNVGLLAERRTDGDGGEVEVEVVGTVQRDGALSVAVVLLLRDAAGEERLEATSTTVRAGAAEPFRVVLDATGGGTVVATGSIANRVLR